MPELIPACFRGGAAAARPPEEEAAASAAAGPSLTTSVYETRLGLVSLSWSRTALGLSLLAELRLRDDGGNDDDDDDDDDEPLAFRIRPWLFWKRRGSKRFHLGDHRHGGGGGGGPRSVELAWDLTRARFPPGGAPEPAGGYFVAIAVDGEFALVAGDLPGEAYRRTAARWTPRGEALLISRREHVAMRRDARSCAVRSYSTSARFGGKEREITITLTSKEKEKEKEKEKKGKFKGKKFKGEDMAMSISVDGSRVLHVRRLRWKFRGSDTVDIDSSPIQISWDLHSWLFPPRRDADADADAAPPPPPPPPPPRAVFVFRFDREPTQSDPKTTTKYDSQVSAPEKKRGSNFSSYGRGVVEEYLGKLSRRNWSESSSYDNNNNNNERIKRRNNNKKKKSLLKTSSSSSTASSTASTMSGSTVMDWASAEETEMQRGEGFSLLVYALKS